MVDLEKIKCPAGEELYWYGCYEREIRFKKYLDPKTFAHPAKMSLPLADRIFKHLNKLGLIKEGDTVIDFMAGSSRTGIIASMHDCKFIGVELEPHFVEMSNKNREELEKQLGRKVEWEVIQGDSRNLSEILKEGGVGVVSPPYQDSRTVGKRQTRNLWGEQKKGGYGDLSGYNPSNPSNIGNLKDKPLVGMISPPYSEEKTYQIFNETKGFHSYDKNESKNRMKRDYAPSITPSNIGNLPDKPLVGIVSPPYSEAMSGGGINKKGYKGKYGEDPNMVDRIWSKENLTAQRKRIMNGKAKMQRPDAIMNETNIAAKGYFEASYSSNPSNIGNLKDKPLVGITSPPFGQAQEGGGIAKEGYKGSHIDEMGKNQPDKVGQRCGFMKEAHGSSDGQIANLSDRPLVGIVSPPYQAGIGDFKNKREDFVAWIQNELKTKGYIEWNGQRYTEKEWRQKNYGRIDGRVMVGSPKMGTEGYNPSNPSNIGNLPDKPLVGITSPPFLESLEFKGKSLQPLKTEKGTIRGRGFYSKGGSALCKYSSNRDNIGNLKDKPLVGITSPPYGDIAAQFRNTGSKLGGDKFQYGNNKEENIGNLADVANYEDNTKAAWWRNKAAARQSESYLEAMRRVYYEAFRSGISPLVVVTKNPTRDGALRRLDLGTAFLLEQVGYNLIDYHRAILFTEHEQQTLTNSTIKKPKGRLSFFKRLSWAKGSPVAQWEDILFAVIHKDKNNERRD